MQLPVQFYHQLYYVSFQFLERLQKEAYTSVITYDLQLPGYRSQGKNKSLIPPDKVADSF